MLKIKYLMFICITLLNTHCAMLLAKEDLENIKTHEDKTCENNVIIFSCTLESNEQMSICANNTPPTLKLSLKLPGGNKYYNVSSPQQFTDAGPGWGATIIKSGNADSPINLFIYVGRSEGDEYSAIEYPENKTGICKIHTSHSDRMNKTKDGVVINLWNLSELGIASGFFDDMNDKEQSELEKTLWNSWPKRK